MDTFEKEEAESHHNPILFTSSMEPIKNINFENCSPRSSAQLSGVMEISMEKMRPLFMFRNPLDSISVWSHTTMFLSLLFDAVAPIIQVISFTLSYFLGFYFLKGYNDAALEASLGLYTSFMNFFCLSVAVSLGEKLGVCASEAYGAQRYDKLKKYLKLSVVSGVLFFVAFMLPLSIISPYLLNLMRLEELVVTTTTSMLRLSIPIMITTVSGEIIKTFGYSQGIEAPFGYTNTVTLVLTTPLMYYLMVVQGYGCNGFVITKIVNEILNILVYFVIVHIKCKPETIGWDSETPIFTPELKEYTIDCVKYIISFYFDWFTFEMNTIFAMSIGDTNALAAFTIWVNIAGFMFYAGMGISNVLRTRLNAFIGMGLNKAAERFYWWFIIMNQILTTILRVFTWFLRFWLISIYTENQKVADPLLKIMEVYIVLAVMELNFNTVMVGIRSIGRVDFVIKLNLVFALPFMFFVGLLGLHVFGYGIWWLSFTFAIG